MKGYNYMSTHKGKLKIILIFTLLFLAVTALLILIFFAGKKTYVVRYDINGGTLISGSLEQHITQGQNAIPPTVVKDGAYLHSWSASSNHITKDMVITAVWNYETTKGIIYSYGDSQNFAEITGAYKYISGEVYLGSYYEEKRILGIGTEAFANCQRITKIYLLDGLPIATVTGQHHHTLIVALFVGTEQRNGIDNAPIEHRPAIYRNDGTSIRQTARCLYDIDDTSLIVLFFPITGTSGQAIGGYHLETVRILSVCLIIIR